jgi:hypothetical protein
MIFQVRANNAIPFVSLAILDFGSRFSTTLATSELKLISTLTCYPRRKSWSRGLQYYLEVFAIFSVDAKLREGNEPK